MSGTVLVTGASRGIGRAIALRLARDGYDIVVHYHSRHEAAGQVAAEIRALGREARCLPFDVAQRDAVAAALGADIEAHGAYYGVVCNAGITRDAPFPGMSGEQWDQVLRTNLDSFYNVLQPVIMPMIRRHAPGRVVTLASVSGLMGNRGQTNYSAAKGGIIAATKALAVELAKREITVNCVAPGLIDTDMVDANTPMEQILQVIPMNRIGTPDECTGAFLFLASTQLSGYVTGQIIEVNGGQYMP